MKSFRERIENKEMVITAELFAPKGIDMTGIKRKVEILREHVHAFNVTDNQRATMRVGSLGICAWLENKMNVETIFQLNCRDRNRLALQSDLLSASLLGIKNVLVITGDHPSVGDHKHSKAVFDLDSVQLLSVIKELERGYDFSGNELKGSPTIFSGSTINPAATPIEPHVIKFKKKVEAGAQFFQTQVVFETDKFIKFQKKIKNHNVPVIAGISLLKNYEFAKFLDETVPGLNVPEDLLERMKNSKDYKKERIEIACETIQKLKPYVAGFHFMVFGLEKEIPLILERM
ncbi:MAG: methylenetetrahydrofolate reductase [Candidatus Muiribacteriota bacterium]